MLKGLTLALSTDFLGQNDDGIFIEFSVFKPLFASHQSLGPKLPNSEIHLCLLPSFNSCIRWPCLCAVCFLFCFVLSRVYNYSSKRGFPMLLNMVSLTVQDLLFHFIHIIVYELPVCFCLWIIWWIIDGHVHMWDLYYKEGWELKNWCFQIVVVEKIPESHLTARRSNQSILKEINTDYSLEGLMLKSKHLMRRSIIGINWKIP